MNAKNFKNKEKLCASLISNFLVIPKQPSNPLGKINISFNHNPIELVFNVEQDFHKIVLSIAVTCG
jgi:hypothetical protein